jgi:hypothetical protein
MFAGKARAYPSEAPFRLAGEKHFKLLKESVNYGRIKFYITGPWGIFSKKISSKR